MINMNIWRPHVPTKKKDMFACFHNLVDGFGVPTVGRIVVDKTASAFFRGRRARLFGRSSEGPYTLSCG